MKVCTTAQSERSMYTRCMFRVFTRLRTETSPLALSDLGINTECTPDAGPVITLAAPCDKAYAPSPLHAARPLLTPLDVTAVVLYDPVILQEAYAASARRVRERLAHAKELLVRRVREQVRDA